VRNNENPPNPFRYTFTHERTSTITQAEGGELHRVIIQSHICPPKVMQSRIDRRRVTSGNSPISFANSRKKPYICACSTPCRSSLLPARSSGAAPFGQRKHRSLPFSTPMGSNPQQTFFSMPFDGVFSLTRCACRLHRYVITPFRTIQYFLLLSAPPYPPPRRDNAHRSQLSYPTRLSYAQNALPDRFCIISSISDKVNGFEITSSTAVLFLE